MSEMPHELRPSNHCGASYGVVQGLFRFYCGLCFWWGPGPETMNHEPYELEPSNRSAGRVVLAPGDPFDGCIFEAKRAGVIAP